MKKKKVVRGLTNHEEGRPRKVAEWKDRPCGGPIAKGGQVEGPTMRRTNREGWPSRETDHEEGRPRRVAEWGGGRGGSMCPPTEGLECAQFGKCPPSLWSQNWGQQLRKE